MSIEAPLSVNIYRDAIITPLEGCSTDAFKFRLGGFSSNGDPIEDFQLVRFWGKSVSSSFMPSVGTIQGTVQYGGLLSTHFGHFLLETLSRIWWLRRSSEPILWHRWGPLVTPWQREIFALVGISMDRFLYVTEPLKVGAISVAEPGFVIGMKFHPEQARALAMAPFKPPTSGRKVWLSRSALPDGLNSVRGETEIEGELRTRGWQIVHPETLSVCEQIAAVSDAEIIAGFEGSAFHALVLLQECRAKVRIIVRQSRLNPNFDLIAHTKGLEQKHLAPKTEKIVGSDGAIKRKIIDRREVIEFVHEP